MLGLIFDPPPLPLEKKVFFCMCIRYLVDANFHLQFHMVETLLPLVSAMDFSCRITHSTNLWHDVKHDFQIYTEHLARFQVLTSQ